MKKVKILAYVLGASVVIVGIGIGVFWKDINEIRAVMAYANAFEPDVIDENFRSFYKQYPAITLAKTGDVSALSKAERADALPEKFDYEGQMLNTAEYLEKFHTTGLIVYAGGNIVHEEYRRGNGPSTQSILMSVSKSVASILMGMALEDGRIDSLDDPVVKYVPELKGTGYDGATIQNVMNMSSGVRWNEDYGDLESDLVQSVVALLTGSLDEFTKTVPRELEPGTYNRYASIDTHVLGMVLRSVTGKSYQEFLKTRLWNKLGAEYDAFLSVDTVGQPLVFGGLHMTLRDLTRIGLVMLNGGRNHLGEQLVSPAWIRESTTPDAPHLMPGKDNKKSSYGFGYKNQWWLPIKDDGGDFTAIGIYGQFLYISPKRGVVIARHSAYPEFLTDPHMDFQSVAMFQAIARHLSPDS